MTDATLRSEISAERSQRIVGFARRDASGRKLSNVVLIVCPQRTGSTWLYDALRCHPRVVVEPTAQIVRGLGLRERISRYPGALVTDHGGLDVELREDFGAAIPSFEAETAAVTEIAGSLPEFAIEKFHPEFFGWRASSFARQIEFFEGRLESPIRLIYRVRDPRQVMISMWQYKQRDPARYSKLAPEDVPDFIARSFDSLAELSRIRPGLIVDYQDQCHRPIGTLMGIFSWLWPGTAAEQHAGVAASAHHLTDVDLRRSRGQTPFLGPESSAQETNDEIERWLKSEQTAVNGCYVSYEELLGLRQTSRLTTGMTGNRNWS